MWARPNSGDQASFRELKTSTDGTGMASRASPGQTNQDIFCHVTQMQVDMPTAGTSVVRTVFHHRIEQECFGVVLSSSKESLLTFGAVAAGWVRILCGRFSSVSGFPLYPHTTELSVGVHPAGPTAICRAVIAI
jgi:hypothetical protein